MSKLRNAPDEFKGSRLSKGARATGEDDVEGHGVKARFAPGEAMLRNAPEEVKGARLSRGARATGEDDVEGHGVRARIVPDDVKGARLSKGARATGEDDVEGHWMPDAGSSLRLAKARNSDIERDARQHQLANEARQARQDHDPKRTHQKG
jgi:hypothetical protein